MVKVAISLLMALACLAGRAPAAAEVFLGVDITPPGGLYVAPRAVVVRAQPSAEGRRVGSLAAEDRVEAVGRAGGAAWLAVRRDGRDLGFVPAASLMALIDGQVDEVLRGTVQPAEGPACSYAIRFSGKSSVPGLPFETADYDVLWSCTATGRRFEVYSFLFVTEGPIAVPAGQQHQISVDVPAIAAGYDRVLSTVLLYDPERQVVRLDRAPDKVLAVANVHQERAAVGVAEALRAAAELAAASWPPAVWLRLMAGDDPADAGDGVPDGPPAAAD